MANTILQIRRSTTTAVPVSLANGELAYTSNGTSNSLFIGSPDGVTGVIRIAGGKYPYLHQSTAGGVLTANAALIADANAYMSNTYTVGLFVSPSISSPAANSTAALITSISPVGNTTQIGSTITGTNNELATTYAITTYVNAKVGGGSVNTQAQYSFSNTITFSNAVSFPVGSRILDSTSSQGTAGQVLTSNGTGNVYWSTVTGVNTASQYTFSNTVSFTANVTIVGNSTSQLLIGNTTVNTAANGTGFYVGNTTQYANITSTGVVTLGSFAVGSNVVVNATSVGVGNSTVYTNTTATGITSTGLGTFATANVTGLANVSSLNVATTANFTGLATFATANVTSLVTAASANVTGLTNTSSLNVGTTSNFTGLATLATANVTSFANLASANVVGAFNVSGLSSFNSNVTINSSLSVTGNLNVTGTVSTIDAINLQVKDNFIKLADGNGGVATDIVDFGFYGVANSGGAQAYYGLGRVASTNTFSFFATASDPSTNNNIIGGLTGMAVSAGALTLTISALGATSGGTAQNTYAAGDTLFASAVNTLSKLTIGTTGNVLQVNATGFPAWGGIDCGTF